MRATYRHQTYKPNSVRCCHRDGHSSRPFIAERLKRPTRKFGASSRDPFWISLSKIPSLFGLAPCGVCHAPCITARAVRSYRTFSPLPHQSNISGSAGLRLLCLRVRLKADRLAPFTYLRRYILCGTFRQMGLNPPSRTLSGTPLFGVRTFLSPGRAARETRRPQPGQRPSGPISTSIL
jgi:hypothetical protein